MELQDLIFFTDDQIANFQNLEITSANDQLLEIFNSLQAAAG